MISKNAMDLIKIYLWSRQAEDPETFRKLFMKSLMIRYRKAKTINVAMVEKHIADVEDEIEAAQGE